uniref:Uncharacterized protein n=1 Tax=Ananas comosus var. bracteatus TaxID=296719 RepID=A0A6V7PJR0_ANACO|nr:unnamed protein product [Ananas comosus var. bracteatus]
MAEKAKAIDQESMYLPDAAYLTGQHKNQTKIQHEMERIVNSAAPITAEEEEEEDQTTTVFGWEWERMDDKLLDALRKGDMSFVRKVFLPVAEASAAVGHAFAIDIADADNVADQAGRRSWRGVTAGGNSALHIVANFGHLELAELICARDSSLLAAHNAALETPLHCAVRAGADRIVSLFISEARQCEEEVLRATDREGKTALHAAVEEGGHAAVKLLLSADSGLAAIVDDNGVSPLYAAVLSKSLEVVQILIESESPAEGGKQAAGATSAGGVTREASYAGPNRQTALHAAAIVESSGS